MSLQFYGKNLHTGVLRAIAAVLLAAIIFIGAKAVHVIASPPQPLALSMASMVIKPSPVAGGASASATVYISAVAPTGGIDVNIVSNKAFASPATSTVHIPAGLKYASFTVTTTAVAADGTATLTATSSSATGSATATIAVTAPVLTQIKLGPATVTAAGSTNGTVYLSGNAAADTTVNLSSDQSFATVPATVTIASGTKYVSFVIHTTPTDTGGTAVISAVTVASPVTTNLVVLPTPPITVTQLKINPTNVNGGGTLPATVYISVPAPSGGTSVDLSTSDGFVHVPSSVTVAEGTKYASFTVTTTAVAADTQGTVTASRGTSSVLAHLNVFAPVLTSLKLGPPSVFGGFPTAATAILNANAPAGGIVVALASDSADAIVPATITIDAGTKYKVFSVATRAVATSGTATITATLAAAAPTAVLTIKQTDLVGIKMITDNVYGGSYLQGKVVLAGFAPTGGTVVTLVSDNANLTVPASVTVPAGKIQVLFNATGVAVATTTAANITATYGTSTGTAAVNVVPGWPQGGGNANATRLGIGSAATGALAWSTNVHSYLRGGVAMAPDGTSYVGNEINSLFAFAPDGSRKWACALHGAPLNCTPALGADGTIYISTNRSSVVAVNPDGTIKWTSPNLYTGMVAVGPDGEIYLGGNDGHLYALSHVDGAVKWTYSSVVGIEGVPAFASDGTVYVGDDYGYLSAVNPTDGSRKWMVQVTGFIRNPAVGTDGLICVAPNGGDVYGINPADGSQKWTVSLTGGAFGQPVFATDGTIYIAGGNDVSPSDDAIYALNPADGVQKWVSHTAYLAAAVALGADGTIYFGCSDTTVRAINPTDGTQIWSTPSGDGQIQGIVAVSLSGTIVHASTDGNVYGLNSDGSPQWTAEPGSPITGDLTIRSDGAVIFGAGGAELTAGPGGPGTGFLGFSASFQVSGCAMTSDGQMLVAYANGDIDSYNWSVSLGSPITGSPSVGADGTVYVCTADGLLHALARSNGSELWYAHVGVTSGSPTIASDGTIYVGNVDGILSAISPDGTYNGYVFYGYAMVGSVVIGADGTLYVGTAGGKLLSINPTSASLNWAFGGGSAISGSPAIGPDGSIYVGTQGGRLYSVSAAGSRNWSKALGGEIHSSPAIAGDGTVYIGSTNAIFYALNPADGSTKWTYTTNGAIRCSPAIAADGTVYVGDMTGRIYAFGP